MPRVPFYHEVKNSTGVPVSGATVTIKGRISGTNSALYTAETGGAAATNPITTDSLGRAFAWIDRGAHNATVAGTGITTYTFAVDDAAGADQSMAGPWASVPSQLVVSSAGKSIVDQAEVTSSLTYTPLTTPDLVTVTLPTNGIIQVVFFARWASTLGNNERISVFLNGVQALKGSGTGAPSAPVDNAGGLTPNVTDGTFNYVWAGTHAFWGLGANGNDVNYATGGQLFGGGPPMTGATGPELTLFAAAGTYDVSIQYRNINPGTLTVKSRKLWVWTMGF